MTFFISNYKGAHNELKMTKREREHDRHDSFSTESLNDALNEIPIQKKQKLTFDDYMEMELLHEFKCDENNIQDDDDFRFDETFIQDDDAFFAWMETTIFDTEN